MTPVSYFVAGERSSPKFATAFASGCRGRATSALRLQPGPAALFGSPPAWPVLRSAQRDGRDWFYGDHGFWGRGEYFRITRNAYQHDGRGSAPTDRFAKFKERIRPWRTSGSHIVLCPNSAIYCGLHGFDVAEWLTVTIARLRTATDREIRVRWKTDEPRRPLALDLLDAWAVVVYSSAAAVHALAAGVPVVTLAPFASTFRMGATDPAEIERPTYPDDRESFLAVLAYQQWTLPEIARGMAWRSLTHKEAASAA
jgi:hypothetical protein